MDKNVSIDVTPTVLETNSCDPVIGICTKGCKQGYKGLMCGLGNQTNYKLQITGQNSVRYHSMSYWISKVNNKMM